MSRHPTPEEVAAQQQQALREQLMQGLLFTAQTFVEAWPTYLDGLEGMVTQTVQRGWTEQQARRLVVAMVVGTEPEEPPTGGEFTGDQ